MNKFIFSKINYKVKCTYQMSLIYHVGNNGPLNITSLSSLFLGIDMTWCFHLSRLIKLLSTLLIIQNKILVVVIPFMIARNQSPYMLFFHLRWFSNLNEIWIIWLNVCGWHQFVENQTRLIRVGGVSLSHDAVRIV